MCDGRSFEEVDSLTLFDIGMMNAYRERHPHVEDLASLIAQYFGVYKPPAPKEAVDTERPPDPRKAIAEAFARAKFTDPSLGDIQNV